MSQDLSIYTEDYYLRDQIEFYFSGLAVPILLGLGYNILNEINEDIQGYVLMEKQ